MTEEEFFVRCELLDIKGVKQASETVRRNGLREHTLYVPRMIRVDGVHRNNIVWGEFCPPYGPHKDLGIWREKVFKRLTMQLKGQK